MVSNPQLPQKIIPVVLPPDQVQSAVGGVGRVYAYIEKILSQPEHKNLDRGSVSGSEKIPGQKEREADLHKGATCGPDKLACKPKEEVSGFVNDQIGIVNKTIMATVGNKINGKWQQKKGRHPFFYGFKSTVISLYHCETSSDFFSRCIIG